MELTSSQCIVLLKFTKVRILANFNILILILKIFLNKNLAKGKKLPKSRFSRF
jgi:hypothetical protein